MRVVFILSMFVLSLYAKIIELKDSNFDSFINSHTAVIVNFQSPKCGNCKRFAPAYEEFAKASAKKNLPYIVAKLNVVTDEKTADKYAVGKLPIVKFFFKGKPYQYYGETSSGYILKFIEQLYKELMPHIEISSEEELKKIAETKSFAAILIGGNKENVETFEKLSKEFDGIWFYHATMEMGQKVFKEINKDSSIVLIKGIDEDKSIYDGPFETKAMESFIRVNSKPKVSGLNQEVIGSIFKQGGKYGIILLREENEEGKKAESAFVELAEKHRGEDLVFVVTGIEDELGKRVAKMLSLTKANLPRMEIVVAKKKLERTKFEGSLTFEEMNKFIENWKAGNAKKTDL